MLFTLKTKTENARDIGFLLHKNPSNVHEKKMAFGTSHVFYPEVEDNVCSMTFLLDIDPFVLIRGKRGESSDAYPLQHYVNDRPYVTSSFMSVAIAQMFGTALNGNCKKNPELVDKVWPLEISIPTVPVKGGEKFLRGLFEPLGYEVILEAIPLDDEFESWGNSPYFSVTLKGNQTIQDVLGHLYVFFPVLDNKKHYWVNESEIEKLFARGGQWLNEHPLKEGITKRYLLNLKSLTRSALETLLGEQEEVIVETEQRKAQREQVLEKKLSLNDIRMNRVVEKLKEHEVSNIIDLGCGEGCLLKLLLQDKSFTKIVGVDVSKRELQKAKERLNWDDLPDMVRSRIELIIGSVIYRDERFSGFDALTLVEVIEHVELNRLIHLERVVFEYAAPNLVILTTPNVEYNKVFGNLPQGQMRHGDHRFEWTRKEFEDWAKEVGAKYGYQVDFFPVGPIHEVYGAPTQMGVFKK